MRRCVFAVLISGCFTTSALAQVTGNDWKDYCAAGEQTPKYALCVGFLSGSMDGIRLMQKATGTTILCEPPTSVTVPQWVAVIRRYLDQHPEQLHLLLRRLSPRWSTKLSPASSDEFPPPADDLRLIGQPLPRLGHLDEEGFML
jgi:hypothetical protein